MLYDLQCECGEVTEFMMLMDDTDKVVQCDACEGDMTRRKNRLYDVPQIAGDTVSGGCSYQYYDENLGQQITGKQHRKDVMKQRGLTEYSPDPQMKKHRVEARYIANQANGSDPEAKAAIRREYKTASDTRRNRNLEKSLSDSFEKIGL